MHRAPGASRPAPAVAGVSIVAAAARSAARARVVVRAAAVACACAAILASPGGCSAAESPRPATGIALESVAEGLEHPLYLTAPAGDPRLFIVEQPGRIRVVRDGRLVATPFLDLRHELSYGGERGLLSIAFHPAYSRNGLFFVNYTDRGGDTRIERYHVGSDPDRADPASRQLVLAVHQPYANHNGGHLQFGPDGMLYAGMGDGGSGGDPHGNGQDLATLLGKLLRLDVDHGLPYTIPRDNPFAGRPGARGEIWAFGLRNPWRFYFDPPEGRLYVADVGQNRWEEVDVVAARTPGLNFGWNRMEGAHPYGGYRGSASGLARPALEYGHAEGCSVIGGPVYRGRTLPGLAGHYFFSDYCSGWIRSFRLAGGAMTSYREWKVGRVGAILSFGVDAAGEIYVCSANGHVYRLVAKTGQEAR